MAESNPVVDTNTKAELQNLVKRARSAHQMLTETFESFISVIEDAESFFPEGSVEPLGVVRRCKGCGKSYPERRNPASAEHGYCSQSCAEKD